MQRPTILALAALLSLALFASPALAQPYLALRAGLAVVNDSDLKDDLGGTGELTFDTGYAASLAVGAALSEMFRLEGEFGYVASDTDEISDGVSALAIDGELTSLLLMANAYLDLSLDPSFAPFIGVGVGAARHEIEFEGLGSEDDTVFAYQVMAGLSLSPSEAIAVDLQYRYVASQDPDFNGLEAEADANLVLAGVRVKF